jgi:hypothetical protein
VLFDCGFGLAESGLATLGSVTWTCVGLVVVSLSAICFRWLYSVVSESTGSAKEVMLMKKPMFYKRLLGLSVLETLWTIEFNYVVAALPAQAHNPRVEPAREV